ncbi:MAG: metalloregulator ArsR/SmtB family transcription factor [archaeon]|nr:metalloregulator ArsR/SmtB family transcription factor [archaeon]
MTEQCNCIKEETQARVREGMLDDDTVMELADLFKIFGDSTRIRILWVLHECEMCVQGISQAVGMSVSAVSHQLKSLKDADLVRTRRDGKQVYYSLCDEHIEMLLNIALEHIREAK